MNADTGHLVNAEAYEDMLENSTMEAELYERVPKHLETAAKLELMGKRSTYVGLNSTGSVARHMKKKRKAMELLKHNMEA